MENRLRKLETTWPQAVAEEPEVALQRKTLEETTDEDLVLLQQLAQCQGAGRTSDSTHEHLAALERWEEAYRFAGAKAGDLGV